MRLLLLIESTLLCCTKGVNIVYGARKAGLEAPGPSLEPSQIRTRPASLRTTRTRNLKLFGSRAGSGTSAPELGATHAGSALYKSKKKLIQY